VREQGVYQQLRSHLAYLRLTAAAEQLPAALQQAEKAKLSHTRFLERLLAAEVEATERRRLEGRIRFASFPTQITLADIDYDAQPGLDRALVNELETLRFVEEHGNVLLIGPPGPGSHCPPCRRSLRKQSSVGACDVDSQAFASSVRDLDGA
jgi:DNA replication protein DnaC